MQKLTLFSFLIYGLFLLGCETTSDISPADNDTGQAGSYARFLVVKDHMYVVTDTELKTFDVSTPDQPKLIEVQEVGNRIESVFQFDGRLFIGSGEALYIYQIEENGLPTALSDTEYFDASQTFQQFACDPVVANETHAYVTLNTLQATGEACGNTIFNAVNELRVYDISDLANPQQIGTYPMLAPKGVGIDGDLLFVCDHTAGLRVLDVSNPLALQEIAHFPDITTYDVIPLDGLLLVVGPTDIYQFDYSDPANIRLLSSITYKA